MKDMKNNKQKTEEWKKNHREAMKKKWKDPEFLAKRKLSEETRREKIKKSMTDIWKNNKDRKKQNSERMIGNTLALGHSQTNPNSLKNLELNRNKPMNDSTKQKLRDAALSGKIGFQKGNSINKGRKQSPEVIEKRRQVMLKIMQTLEYKEAHRKGMLGHKVSDSTKQKIAESRLGEKHWTKRMEYPEDAKEKLREARLHQVFPKKDSKPELMVQALFDINGIRYEPHKAILGQPDLYVEPNICVFVDGCYFHGCELCYPENCNDTIPRNSLIRDAKVNTGLSQQGYWVLRVPEHDIMSVDSDYAREKANQLVSMIKNLQLISGYHD